MTLDTLKGKRGPKSPPVSNPVPEYPTGTSVSLWIRAHLAQVNEDYPYRMWQEYVKFAKGFMRNKICNYNSFRKYVHAAVDGGLLERNESRVENANTPFQSVRHYYRLKLDKLTSERWKHIQYSKVVT